MADAPASRKPGPAAGPDPASLERAHALAATLGTLWEPSGITAAKPPGEDALVDPLAPSAARSVRFMDDAGDDAVGRMAWHKARTERQQEHETTLREDEAAGRPPSEEVAPAPSAPDKLYPPQRVANFGSDLFGGDEEMQDMTKSMFGANCAPIMKTEPLPPIGPVFFFRVLQDQQPVRVRPVAGSQQIGQRALGEVVRVVDFDGAWARLACETEAQLEEKWVGWILVEGDSEVLLEEITDPDETEKAYTKDLFRRIWKINDNIRGRLGDRSERAQQYMHQGRVPPGKREDLPEGTRCVNAFWGLELRYIKLAQGDTYWPQGCMSLGQNEEARTHMWRVFAGRPFGKGELVEICPLIPIDIQSCIASIPLRMNIVEVLIKEDAAVLKKMRGLRSHLPLGYGMCYQQHITLDGIEMNWEPVANYNCKFIAANEHLYIYTTRSVQANEELVLHYERNFRTDEGETIDFTGYTPYWRRPELPATFAKALKTPMGPRPLRPIPGNVKFGRSKLHGRGSFADAAYKKGEIIEICPCLILDDAGIDCVEDLAFKLGGVKVQVGDRTLLKREELFVMPLGYMGMCNHLPQNEGENAIWLYDETTQCMVIVAMPPEGGRGDGKEILRNEELCFDYGDLYWAQPERRGMPGYGKDWKERGGPQWLEGLDRLQNDWDKRRAGKGLREPNLKTGTG